LSRPGKRLALLLTLLGVVFQLWLGPRALPWRTRNVSTAGNLAVDLPGPAKYAPARPAEPRLRPAAGAPDRPPHVPEGIATPVEDPLPLRGPGAAHAVIVPVDVAAAMRRVPPAAPRSARPAQSTPRRASIRRSQTVYMLVTAYCPCRKCCGRYTDGKTACGHTIHANGSRFVAADTRVLPFGTRVSVPGYHQGAAVPVLDRGKRIRDMRLDVFFLSHHQARRWGAKWLPVTVFFD